MSNQDQNIPNGLDGFVMVTEDVSGIHPGSEVQAVLSIYGVTRLNPGDHIYIDRDKQWLRVMRVPAEMGLPVALAPLSGRYQVELQYGVKYGVSTTKHFDGYNPQSPEHTESIQDKFEAFLLENPNAYSHFCRIAHRLLSAGKTHYSADAICHVMRYETAIDGRPEEEYKINNNFVRCFSRKWQKEHQQYPDFFENRTIKTA